MLREDSNKNIGAKPLFGSTIPDDVSIELPRRATPDGELHFQGL